MKASLRSAVVVAATASSLAMFSSPASAEGAVVFTGTANINCFGCGVSTGTGCLTVTGYVLGQPIAGVGVCNTAAVFTVNEPVGATCVVTGSASGSTSGAVDVSFNWTRVGATAVITTSGDINGSGTAAFAVTSPVGNPCGGPVTAQVAGEVAGT